MKNSRRRLWFVGETLAQPQRRARGRPRTLLQTGTNDVRESPAFPIMRRLLDVDAVVKAYDPVAKEEAQKAFREPKVSFCDNLNSVLAALMHRGGHAVEGVSSSASSPPGPQARGVFVDARRAFDKQSSPTTKASVCKNGQMTSPKHNSKGLFVRLKKIKDHRGFFARGWCRDEFAQQG